MSNPEIERKMYRYAELQARAAVGILSAEERDELRELSARLYIHLPPPGDTPDEKRQYQDIQRQVEAFLKRPP